MRVLAIWKAAFQFLIWDEDRAADKYAHHGILHLPPSPRELIQNRREYEGPLLLRKRTRGFMDSRLTALYRMYEHFVLDQHIELRNEFESFWYHSDWYVETIPDPQDTDPERYVVLACLVHLLASAFNERIELGLPRTAPPIVTSDQLEKYRKTPRLYEETPGWVGHVPRLEAPLEVLSIPHWDNDRREFVSLTTQDVDNASRICAAYDVLVFEPHVHFS